jgi:hypothetical protein
MKYLTFCMGITDGKPVVHERFTNVKLGDGTHLMIPILVCESETLEELRTSFAQDVGRMFSAVEKASA